MVARSSPSGNRVDIPSKQLLSWDGVGVQTLIVLPARHKPGLYSIVRSILRRVVASAGTYDLSASWTDPNAGPQTLLLSGAIAATALGAASGGPFDGFNSSGVDPVQLLLTPTGITGSPIVDFYARATLL